jgi:hypothetical protein
VRYRTDFPAPTGYGLLSPFNTKDTAMTTDAQSQGEQIAALHLESLFNSDHLGSSGDDSNRARYAEPAIHSPNEHDAVQLRHRLAFIKRLAISARGLSLKTDVTKAAAIEKTAAIEKSGTPTRASANIAAWKAYLPEDCVAAMIKDGWHRST